MAARKLNISFKSALGVVASNERGPLLHQALESLEQQINGWFLSTNADGILEGPLKIGSATDYTQVAADGIVTMAGDSSVLGDFAVGGEFSADNMRLGTAAFVASGSETVTYATPATSTSMVVATANANVNVWITNKSGTGFDINTSAAFTGNVDWFAIVIP